MVMQVIDATRGPRGNDLKVELGTDFSDHKILELAL